MIVLPEEIEREILHFIIPDSRTITFRNYSYFEGNDKYNNKYDVAFIGNKLIQNENGLYLSRISKKNGKHRYYLTKETESSYCDCCGSDRCNGRYCRGCLIYEYDYDSNFVGKNLEKALLELFA